MLCTCKTQSLLSLEDTFLCMYLFSMCVCIYQSLYLSYTWELLFYIHKKSASERESSTRVHFVAECFMLLCFQLVSTVNPPGDTPTGLTSLIFRFFIFGQTNFKFKRDTLSSLQARPCRSSPARTNMLILHFPGSTSVHGEEKSHAVTGWCGQSLYASPKHKRAFDNEESLR